MAKEQKTILINIADGEKVNLYNTVTGKFIAKDVSSSSNFIIDPGAAAVGAYWMDKLKSIAKITDLRGKGLMIGIDLPEEFRAVRSNLLLKHHIFTGEAKPNTIRLLPSLAITKEEADMFLNALNIELA